MERVTRVSESIMLSHLGVVPLMQIKSFMCTAVYKDGSFGAMCCHTVNKAFVHGFPSLFHVLKSITCIFQIVLICLITDQNKQTRTVQYLIQVVISFNATDVEHLHKLCRLLHALSCDFLFLMIIINNNELLWDIITSAYIWTCEMTPLFKVAL